MNHIYKIIWCSSLQIFKVCSENAKSSKTQSSKIKSSKTQSSTAKIKSKITTFPQLTKLALLLSLTNYAVADVTTTRITVNGANNPITNPKVITEVAIINNGSAASAHAQNGGALQIEKGTIKVNGKDGYALHSKDQGSLITASITINNSGSQGYGAVASEGGEIQINDGSINTSGGKAHGAVIKDGGKINLVNTSIGNAGAGTSAIQVINSGTIEVKGGSLSASSAPTIDVRFGDKVTATEPNRAVNITLGAGTTISGNNGTLLKVDKSEGAGNEIGQTGIVNLTLAANSITNGNINDSRNLSGKTGYTNVNLEDKAIWSGSLFGVNNLSSKNNSTSTINNAVDLTGTVKSESGSTTTFKANASIGQDLTVDDHAQVIFKKNATILKGDVTASNHSELSGEKLTISNGSLKAIQKSKININSSTDITTTANNAYGAVASDGSSIKLTAGKITTQGNQAHGLQSQDEDSSITATGLVIDINSPADQTFGAHATDKGVITLNGGSITTDGERGYGILAQNGGHVESNTNITVNGAKAHAVQAGSLGTNNAYTGSSAGTVNLTGGKLTVNADDGASWAAALHAVDSGRITASTIDIESKSYAALSESSSHIAIDNSIIKTTGNTAALVANNDRRKDNHDIDAQGGKLIVNNTAITTSGDNAIAALAAYGGDIKLDKNSTITTTGNDAIGVSALHSGTITSNNTSIITTGSNSYGAVASDGGSIELTAGKITTQGNQAHGLQSQDEDSSITAIGLDIIVNGLGDQTFTFGAHATDNGLITLNGGSIMTSGNDAIGVSASYGGKITSNNTLITTTGSKSHGAVVSDGGEINLIDGIISTTGSNASTLQATNSGKITVTDTSLISSSSPTISVLFGDSIDPTSTVGTVNISLGKGTTATQNNGTLLIVDELKEPEYKNGKYGIVQLMLEAGSTTSGDLIDARDLPATGAGYTDVTLKNGASWTGNITGIRNFVNENSTKATFNNEANISSLQTSENSSAQFEKAATISKGIEAKQNTIITFNDTASIGTAGSTEIALDTETGSIINFSDKAVTVNGNIKAKDTVFNFSKNENAENINIIGNITLDGNSTTTGGHVDKLINVNGAVHIDGTNSLFGGNWNINGELKNSGILNIGNSIGKTEISGNITFNGSSNIKFEINQNGESDTIITTGTDQTVTQSGYLFVSVIDSLKIGDYTFIKDKGDGTFTVAGEFEDIKLEDKSAFLEAKLSYKDANGVEINVPKDTSESFTANTIDVKIQRNKTTFASVTTSANQAAIANALDKTPTTSSSNNENSTMRVALFTLAEQVEEQTPNVITKIFQLSAEEAEQAFEELAGNTNASIRTGLVSTANITADAINNRIRSNFNGVGSKQTAVLHFVPAETSISNGFWASGFGSWINQKSSANANGLKTSTGGFLTGVDIGLSSGWSLGIATGYSKTDMDAKGHYASTTSDNWHLGAYSGNQWGPLGLRTGVVYTGSSLDGKRAVSYGNTNETLKSDYHAHSTQVFADVGYQIELTPATIEPFLNLSHVNLRTKGYNETGGDAALEVASNTTNTTFSTFGVRAAVPFAVGSTSANFKGTLGWRHAYGDITPVANQSIAGDVFSVEGIAIAKNTVLVETGLDFQISPVATVGLNYVGQYGSGIRENGFNATLNYKF
jgi:outer membrane autotransporter protein